MTSAGGQTMRDAFIGAICERMRFDRDIFFLTADFGAPALDRLRGEHQDRFINVGIAEQNMIGVATGLALEGFAVFAYGIAPFIAMRDYEQIRVHLAILSQTRPLNVNLISVGAGVSYEVSGPTHHCPEDLSLMRTLPNLDLFSPSDAVLAERFLAPALQRKQPKYLRFDGKALPPIYDDATPIDFPSGFSVLAEGDDICLVATGFTTHMALGLASEFARRGVRIGVVDVFSLRPLDEPALSRRLGDYSLVITLEEGFVGKGGLDSLIREILARHEVKIEIKNFGFSDTYVFASATRSGLHKLYGLDGDAVSALIRRRAGLD
jgi:transketolase